MTHDSLADLAEGYNAIPPDAILLLIILITILLGGLGRALTDSQTPATKTTKLITKPSQKRAKMYWDRQATVEEIEQNFRQEFPDMTIALAEEPGGDYDLLAIRVGVDGDSFEITPFVDPNEGAPDVQNWSQLDKMDVYAIEMSDGHDSRGGFNGKSIRLGRLYGGIRAMLNQKGYYTINHYDEIF